MKEGKDGQKIQNYKFKISQNELCYAVSDQSGKKCYVHEVSSIFTMIYENYCEKKHEYRWR
jgi:hypothetical protein